MTIVDEELEEQDAGCIDTEPEQVDELNGDVNVQITDNDTKNIDEGLCCVRKTKKEVVLLITIDPYPVYHLLGN